MDFFTSPKGQEPVLSVAEFIEYVNLVITKKQVVVEGEIASYNVSQNKWVFFDLKDEQSRISCFAVLYQLHTSLEDGMKVRIYSTPRVHQKSGKFSLYVDRVEIQGEGALKKAFELTKAKLEKEGIFSIARKRPLPHFPQKIGMIASRESAAYTDFMRIINQRMGGLEIDLAHVQVQGESAVKEIVAAFDWFNDNDTGAEVIAIVRGGGSMEDLQAFNSEPVVRAIFSSRLPVICGVGHERDETLADYASDVRAATPTHAATMVVPDRDELLFQINQKQRALILSTDNLIEWYGHRTQNAAGKISHHVQGTLHHMTTVLRQFYHQASVMGQRVAQDNQMINHLVARMRVSLSDHIGQKKQTLAFLKRSLEQMSPYTVLKRGYSIVKMKGKVVSSTKDVKPGDSLDIAVSDGTIMTEVIPQKRLI